MESSDRPNPSDVTNKGGSVPPPSTGRFGPATEHHTDPMQAPFRTAGGALMNWWRAVTLDALIVGVLWFIGLEILRVPLAPLWAVLGALFQFIPAFGPMLALIGPVFSVAFSENHDIWDIGLVLGIYGIIAVLEGLVIGPYVLHRTTRVPWWASFLGPIVLGILIPPWGVIIAPPLLAILYAFRRPSPAKTR
ncbi:AI-2E family transporter [Granulicella sibirica]|uniref:Transport protein n=1 Tax=Granulicella sibirica TaxID=2479048 RepID=A0A4Q0T378_9BACT|nr:AI-2E family transporter [Granulicella sibirica]RXH56001.1 transport protein [Granulicella sibirica]